MKSFCAVLGFEIDRETLCAASGKNLLCRKCGGQENERLNPPIANRNPRKRCECGKSFFPKSNRHKFCDRCSDLAEKRRKAEWARETRKNMSVSRRLGANFNNEVEIFQA